MTQNWNPNLYQDKHAFVYQFGEDLVSLLNPQEHERILDLGCGSAQLTALIQEKAKQVIGIDQSAAMIKAAYKHYPHIEFRQADACGFCFSQPFDAIFSNAVLHWVLEPEKAIACIYNNLKPGGRFVAEFGGAGNVRLIVNQLRKSLAQFGFDEQARKEVWFFPSVAKYAGLLEQAGFRVSLAQHADRTTQLQGNKGIENWLTMFATAFFEGVDLDAQEYIKKHVQTELYNPLFFDNAWHADYKRIRVLAYKEI